MIQLTLVLLILMVMLSNNSNFHHILAYKYPDSKNAKRIESYSNPLNHFLKDIKFTSNTNLFLKITFGLGAEQNRSELYANKINLEISKSHVFQNMSYSSSKSLKVMNSDYFEHNCSRKYLHFFQDNAKKLHLFDLQHIKHYPKDLEFEEIDLLINFKIPVWHRSIILPDGTIYLTGGSTPINEGLRNTEYNKDNIFMYDYENKTLKNVGELKYARNSHALCVLKREVYIIGGCTDTGGYTIECEKFTHDPYALIVKGESIASLNYPACAPAVATFNDKYLFKFGGVLSLDQMNNHIERYDPLNNKWKVISVRAYGASKGTSSLSLFCYSGAIQLNKYEMLIFGGGDKEYKTKQNLILRELDQNNYTIEKTSIQLPFHGVFWNNSIIMNSNVFTLQTVKLERSDAYFLSKRKLLCFNSEKWLEFVPQKGLVEYN